MQAGMMWFDNDKTTTLTAKIKTAAGYYRKKYRKMPNLCMVNPSMIPDDLPKDEMMTVRPYCPIGICGLELTTVNIKKSVSNDK